MSFRIAATAVCATVALSGVSGPAWSADQALSTAQTKALIVGNTVKFVEGDTARYYTNGRYKFSGARTSQGNYDISGNRVCVVFDNGNRRCDHYVKSGKDYYLINAAGGRWKIKVRKGT